MSYKVDQLEGSLRNIIEQDSLKWIFVGGRGGAGKTTCSCSLAVELSKVRDSVLLISTDPAHNISNVFDQKFTYVPTKVKGFANLYAVEIDSDEGICEMPPEYFEIQKDKLSVSIGVLRNMMGSLPGVNEALSYAEVMRLIEAKNFSAIIFDTTATGHTLRLLSFPRNAGEGLNRLMPLDLNVIVPFISRLDSLFGIQGFKSDSLTKEFSDLLKYVRHVIGDFKNPDHTTFICVCIAELHSLYETERLVQELSKCGVDTHNIVVNQLLLPKDDETPCSTCASRHQIQEQYLNEIGDLYENFHVTKLPLLDEEVLGVDNIKIFGEYLFKPSIPK